VQQQRLQPLFAGADRARHGDASLTGQRLPSLAATALSE